ncbi:MAG: ABC transporter ATP-binding protein [Candidatus Neomarinimicrobiota bacterium]
MLKAQNITKTFSNGSRTLSVFSDISLDINQGDLITIMGPSGAGKSTLLNILGTLEKPDSGDININGKDVLTMSNKELSLLRNKYLGYVFQFHHLLPEFTALENILMPARIAGLENKEKRALELLDYVGLLERKQDFPSQLSGGERSRIAVLRALINKPALVLADEPTGNLDMGNGNKMVNLILDLNKEFKQAFVLTTHNPDVAEIGHKKYKLENGDLIIR